MGITSISEQGGESGTPSAASAHWADRVADDVIAAGRPPVISTGISPSGEIHIGNMREVLTGDAIHRVLVERGIDVRFNYVADNFDPLRKVYPFLDAEHYERHVGRPISEIPCPCRHHESYADHFLEPFLKALRELRVDPEVERADRMYKSGRMNPWIIRSLECRDQLASILTEMTGKEVAADWSPFNPICADCGALFRRSNGKSVPVKVRGFSAADETVDFACACGASGSVPMAGGGKLIWRVDWPARWMLLGVTVEPFGKDHATRGGSYDTGARIAREVFDGAPPFAVPYEWIRLKGQGDMSSSKGNVLSIGRILKVAPPEALRYLVLRDRPKRTIGFDPGLPLLQLVDQVDDASAKGRDERAVELSRAGGFEPVGVPYKHLVVVAQATEFDVDRSVEALRRSGYPDAQREPVASRMQYARRWLDAFAPEELRFKVQQDLPAAAADLTEAQRRFLGRLAERLAPDLDGEAVHALVYDVAGQFAPTKPGELFQAIYFSLLGKPRGPRAGWFVALLGPERCATRFREAAGGLQ